MQDASKPGIVYFVGFDNYVKIGFTTDMKKRLKGIQTGCPVRLTNYCSFSGTVADERELHTMFHKHRLCCEWFTFHDDIHNWLIARETKLHGPFDLTPDGLIELNHKGPPRTNACDPRPRESFSMARLAEIIA